MIRAGLPGAEEVFWRAARDRHLDTFAPHELAEAEGTDASVAHPGAGQHARAGGRRPGARMARAARARGAPSARPRCTGAGA